LEKSTTTNKPIQDFDLIHRFLGRKGFCCEGLIHNTKMRPQQQQSSSSPQLRFRGKTLFLLIWLFFLSFSLWFLLILIVQDRQHDEIPHSERAPPAAASSSKIVIKKPTGEQQQLPTYAKSRLSPPSFGLVVLTTINGLDRTKERQKIFDSLCNGNNGLLLKQFQFSIYLSVDGVNKPANPLVNSINCGSLLSTTTKLEEWFTQSATSTNNDNFESSATGRIAAHYKFAMKQAFQKHTHVIFLEDDLVPAPDFLSLFVPTSPAFKSLENEPNRVWCISAWNDLGVSKYSSDLERLFRTDFFPGLGWLTTKDVWEDQIKRKWSLAATTGWDNWLRSNNDEERECIVPEVNRVKHVSSQGSNVKDPNNQLYGVYSFSSRSLGSFKLEENGYEYDLQETNRALKAERLDIFAQGHPISIAPKSGSKDVLVIYERSQYQRLLQILGANPPMNEEPRASRKGLIMLRRTEKTDGFFLLCDVVQCAPRFFPHRAIFQTNSQVTTSR
jgi:hypothetical protein